jgi:hypothetical protein
MLMKTKLLGAVVGLAGIAGLATGASASTSFLLGTPGATLTLGTGWGDNSSSLNLFDAHFSTNNLNGSAFNLSAGGSQLFALGSVTIQETNIEGPPGTDETNNLQVTYTFNIDLPNNSNVLVSTTGIATPGAVNDAGIDLIIDFNPVVVNFGVGGQYVVNVSDVIFNNEEQFQPVTVEFRLNSDSQNVPEPMTLGLLGAGLLGMGIAARRRRS